MPDRDQVEVDEPAQDEREQACRGLGSDQRHPLGPDVGDDPAEQAQHQDRQELHRAEQAEVHDGLVRPNQSHH